MSEYVVSPNPVRDLFDAACRHKTVKLTCQKCGHIGIYDPHALWWHFERRGWPDNLKIVPKRLWCGDCALKQRRKIYWPTLDLVEEEPTLTILPMPDERQWKRALSRRR